MRMEPGWFPYRRKPGKPLASAVRPGNLLQAKSSSGIKDGPGGCTLDRPTPAARTADA